MGFFKKIFKGISKVVKAIFKPLAPILPYALAVGQFVTGNPVGAALTLAGTSKSKFGQIAAMVAGANAISSSLGWGSVDGLLGTKAGSFLAGNVVGPNPANSAAATWGDRAIASTRNALGEYSGYAANLGKYASMAQQGASAVAALTAPEGVNINAPTGGQLSTTAPSASQSGGRFARAAFQAGQATQGGGPSQTSSPNIAVAEATPAAAVEGGFTAPATRFGGAKGNRGAWRATARSFG